MKKYSKSYIVHLAALLCSIICLFLIGEYFEGIAFYGVGYCWSLTLVTPELEERVNRRKYKYSFFNLVFKLNSGIEFIFEKMDNKFKEPLVRLCSPLIFMLLILAFGAGLKGIIVLIGCLVFEVVEYLNVRFIKSN